MDVMDNQIPPLNEPDSSRSSTPQRARLGVLRSYGEPRAPCMVCGAPAMPDSCCGCGAYVCGGCYAKRGPSAPWKRHSTLAHHIPTRIYSVRHE